MSASGSGDERVVRAERRLAELGVVGRVTAAGHEREIAAVAVPAAEFTQLAGPQGVSLARELKRVGFRYVALDLLPAE